MSHSSERFTTRAAAYALHRPSYPPAAIDAILRGLQDPITAADVGAGTGISSRLLADRGASVIAIEPNAAMRASATTNPLVTWRAGTAQATGLDDDCVDLVTAFQAFHWFATLEAMEEFRRISRRRVALAQYERDESDAFSAEYGQLVRHYALDDTEVLRMRGPEVFRAFPAALVTESHYRFHQNLGLDGVLGRAASSSYLPQQGTQADALRAEIAALYHRHGDAGQVRMAMIVYVVVADLTPP